MEKSFKIADIAVILVLLIVNEIDVSFGKSIAAPRSPKIVIIGAGPAGIAAASKLLENGFNNVTILEAEDRIGGRVNTVEFGNYSVDLGGQWVHGQEGNVAFNLAYPLGLLDVTPPLVQHYKQIFFDSRGNTLDPILSQNLTDFEEHNLYDLEFHNNNSGYESVGEYVEKMFDEQFKNNPDVMSEKSKYLRNMELSRISFDPADSWDDISALDDGGYKVCAGDQSINWKERGYSTILDILMKRYPDPASELPVMNNTILNTEVTSIDYLSNETGPSILITTKNGQLYKADHVIVTVSLGVLKEKHKTLFIPPLPDYKVATIQGLGFGSVAKIYLLFDEPFWKPGNEKNLIFDFFWNDAERKAIETDPERKWLLGMYSAMMVKHKPKLLALWVTGEYVRLMETMSEDKVINHAAENLHRFMGGRYNVSAPVAMIRSQWHANPHFRGTYSYRSVESQRRKVYSTMLETPLTTEDLKILFAGEATSKDRFSTVDGAIGSGWQAADRLLERYNKLSNGASRR